MPRATYPTLTVDLNDPADDDPKPHGVPFAIQPGIPGITATRLPTTSGSSGISGRSIASRDYDMDDGHQSLLSDNLRPLELQNATTTSLHNFGPYNLRECENIRGSTSNDIPTPFEHPTPSWPSRPSPLGLVGSVPPIRLEHPTMNTNKIQTDDHNLSFDHACATRAPSKRSSPARELEPSPKRPHPSDTVEEEGLPSGFKKTVVMIEMWRRHSQASYADPSPLHHLSSGDRDDLKEESEESESSSDCAGHPL